MIKVAITSSNRFLKPILETAKSIAFRYTPLGAPRYPYNVEPIQLATLINEIERLKETTGCIVEIGVARGMTTRFMAQHLKSQHLDCERLYAIDTFESFTDSDLDYEVAKRGKARFDVSGFKYIEYNAWVRNFRRYEFVTAIRSDCSVFDYTTLGPIKLAFLDVDLYLPTKNTLPRLFANLVSGGAILVDDVRRSTSYDGAYQAYMEFCEELGIPQKVIGSKCGIIRK